MKTFDVQSVSIQASPARVFAFIAEPTNLPRWTSAFKRADNSSAQLATPQGVVDIGLSSITQLEAGTIDWKLTFSDGSVGVAYSRVMPDGESRSVYSFLLMAPPAPLEALEGALEAQREILAQELIRLKGILESR